MTFKGIGVPLINRRQALQFSSGIGLGVAASTILATPAEAIGGMGNDARINGPYLDLRTKEGTMEANGRIYGNTDAGVPKFGWYDGYVMGVAPGGPVKNICGFKGMSSAKLIPNEGKPGWRKVLREVGFYYDLKTGEILEEMINPYTEEKVRVVHVANDPFNQTIEPYYPPPPNYGGLNEQKEPMPQIPIILTWNVSGDERLLMERHIHLYYPNALKPSKWVRESSGPMNRVSEMFFFNMSLEDMQNPDLTSIEYSGTWGRITPWLPWLLMGQAPGNVVYQTFMGGYDKLEDIPKDILDYTTQNYEKYLTPPPDDYGPSLSSLEMYAREQEPAQPGGV